MRLFMTGQSYSTKNSWDQYEFGSGVGDIDG